MDKPSLIRDIAPSDTIGGVKQVIGLLKGWYRNFPPDGDTVGSWSFLLKDCDASLFVLAAQLWANDHEDWPPSGPQFLATVRQLSRKRRNETGREATARLIEASKARDLRYGIEPQKTGTLVRLWEHGRVAPSGGEDGLINEIAEALGGNQFFLAYQPIVEMTSKRIEAAEALIRWNHPERGLVMPDEFIPDLEQTPLIVLAGKWILQQACRQWAEWIKDEAVVEPFFLHVNVSRAQLSEELASCISSALEDNHLDAGKLCVEITETAFSDTERIAEAICKISDLGVLVGVDDFGAGYSAMSMLASLPIDVLKIDKGLTARVGTAKGKIVIEGICRMAERLGVTVIAEGVETQDQVETLLELGCRLGQGHLFAEAGSAEQIRVSQTTDEGGGSK